MGHTACLSIISRVLLGPPVVRSLSIVPVTPFPLQIVFHAPVVAMVPYFGRHGYPCPTYTNPAYYLFREVCGTRGGSCHTVSSIVYPYDNMAVLLLCINVLTCLCRFVRLPAGAE